MVGGAPAGGQWWRGLRFAPRVCEGEGVKGVWGGGGCDGPVVGGVGSQCGREGEGGALEDEEVVPVQDVVAGAGESCYGEGGHVDTVLAASDVEGTFLGW